MGKYEDANKCFDRAIEINPKESLCFYNKGKLGRSN
jgi:tetratricopeptide (TPR) repeat protein